MGGIESRSNGGDEGTDDMGNCKIEIVRIWFEIGFGGREMVLSREDAQDSGAESMCLVAKENQQQRRYPASGFNRRRLCSNAHMGLLVLRIYDSA